MRRESYDPVTIRLHWATAFLVVFQWGQAHLIDLVTTGGTPGRRAMISIHVLAGLALLAVLLARLYWRHAGRGVRLPYAAGAQGLLARLSHLVLYGLLLATTLVGVWFEWVRGDNIFGVLQIPAFDPGNRALRASTKAWHVNLADALLIFSGVHALAAIGQHLLRRDRVLARMLPRLG